MVSLKKQTTVREITPVHLVDEVETQHTDCQEPLTNAENNHMPPAKAKNGVDKDDIRMLISSILIGLFITGLLVGVVLFLTSYLAEGFQLIKDINFH